MGHSEMDGVDASPEASESLSVPASTEIPPGQDSPPKPDGGNVSTPVESADVHVSANGNMSSAAVSNANTPAPDEPLQSVPMTATTSNSSHDSAKDAAQTITHYGTRSRNKPASARPNYAEDVEMEFDNPSKALVSRDAPSSPTAASRLSPASQAKRGASVSNGISSVNQNSTNSTTSPSIPGTSTFSANPNNSVSKKRKAATTATSTTTPASTPVHPSSRRATAASTRDSALSNMFTFEKSNGKLKNGKLIADDGTAFSVNGKCPVSFSFSPCARSREV
jgi:hypothetical protein